MTAAAYTADALHPGEHIPEGEEAARVSPREIEIRGGLSAADSVELAQAMGLPAPEADEPYFTIEEADVLIRLGHLGDVWPREVYLQASRVYGQAIEAIARTEVQLFRLHVERRLREAAASDSLTALAELRAAVAELLPLADPMLAGLHRRLVEHELTEAAVSEAEMRSFGGRVAGTVDVTFVFCDLKDFTAYADVRGDAAAVDAIERFATVVSAERGDTGHIVKGLGDGYLLTYADPAEAVAAGSRIVERLRGEDTPGVHASVHSGPAVFRNGDYFGASVNLAARVLGVSGRDELLATRAVVDATAERFRWTPRPAERLRGLRRPVDLWRLAGER